eukprot:CAMPEP_0171529796 /NCGR_PEP_ID=MMETSP0959-20130129/12584_1 /TAXON_ID=87120 /ORGANISM="Aurantiochytrium limacinum, Strain ATCCMYA-1381" /LENGTH=77 /DNA_ID=CAMNT_0012072243 /DNA_START=250 /DNA_END=483 /DNA_ORIENTATION=+
MATSLAHSESSYATPSRVCLFFFKSTYVLSSKPMLASIDGEPECELIPCTEKQANKLPKANELGRCGQSVAKMLSPV